MVCYAPLKAYRKPDGGISFSPSTGYRDRPLDLKCGQCEGCRLAYSREWAIRCYHESQMHENNCFVTLTYATIPEGGTLIANELSKFMIRLRTAQGNGIRFFGCGEYGDDFGRPHYHAIIFNWRPNDLRKWKQNKQSEWIYTSRQLDKIWSLGYTYTGEATFKSAAYTARYILKKITGKQAQSHYKTIDPETGEITQEKLPEYTRQSLGNSETGGIGKTWYDQFGNTDAHDHDQVILGGRKFPVPRYYDKILEERDPERYARIRNERLRNARSHADNNTPARLKVRERVQQRKSQRLPRDDHEKGLDQ